MADDPDHAAPASPPSSLETRLATRFPSMAGALKGLDGRALWIMLSAALILVVFRKFGSSGYYEAVARPDSQKGHPYLSVYGDWYWFLNSFFGLGVLPVLLTLPRRLRPQALGLGLGLGDWRFSLKWLAILLGIMVPVVLVAAQFGTFWKYYPLNGTLGQQAALWVAGKPVPDGFLAHFIAYELLYGLYFIGWEYFFRGYMTFGLYDRLGVNGVLIGTIPFALLHVGKPFPEAVGSIVAGVALGLFALRARSFWPCWILHAAIAWTMDAAAIWMKSVALG